MEGFSGVSLYKCMHVSMCQYICGAGGSKDQQDLIITAYRHLMQKSPGFLWSVPGPQKGS
jgi:hypothetical protein